jgi:hypothetical protein
MTNSTLITKYKQIYSQMMLNFRGLQGNWIAVEGQSVIPINRQAAYEEHKRLVVELDKLEEVIDPGAALRIRDSIDPIFFGV